MTALTVTCAPRSVRPSWRALATALGGNALGAFPAEAFEEEVVIHRLFGRAQFILNHPDAIRHVLVENAGNYLRPAPTIRVLLPIFGSGLFLSSGEEWKRQRRTVAPAFALRAVRILASHVAAAANTLVAQLEAADGGPVQLVPVLQRLALEIIGSAMFSLQMQKYGAAMRELILRYAARLGRPTLMDFLLPAEIPTPYDLARRRFRKRWQALVERIIAERQLDGGGAPQRDLFDLLVGAESAGSDAVAERLADQVATIIVAGHETTAAALFWSLYLLALSPSAQRLVADEAETVDLAPAGAVEAVGALTRTRAAVDEALRLYPPAFVIVRQAVAADIAAGIPIPARSLILIAPWVLHRHRRLWTEPETFDPSRFLPSAPPPPRFAYLPFGIGPRTCIGAQFALTELVLVIATIVRAFQIELAERRTVRPVGIVSTQPENPLPFLLRPRRNSAKAASLCL
ncbi:MAG TPA: cytochrome P450 [Stellaceae bacterium]|nr:cytochrome P450 [Stellaceae bacterium]